MVPPEEVSLSELLRRRGVRLSARRGQNFMVDHNMLDFLVRSACIHEHDIVLEVGTGIGFLTERLLGACARVISVELDRGLYSIAAERLAGAEGLVLVEGDAIEGPEWHPRVCQALREAAAALPGSPLKMCSNLPYSAATAVVQAVLLGGLDFAKCTFTVQWEVADRLTAGPGGRDYGYISALVALFAEARIIRKLPAAVFWPRPKVESAIVELRPLARGAGGRDDRRDAAEALSILFSNRRKEVLGILRRCGFDESVILEVRKLMEEKDISARERVFRLEPAVLREIARIMQA